MMNNCTSYKVAFHYQSVHCNEAHQSLGNYQKEASNQLGMLKSHLKIKH